MALEKKFRPVRFVKENIKEIFLAGLCAFLISCPDPVEPPKEEPNPFDYITSVNVVESEEIGPEGGEIIVNAGSFIDGTSLTIPQNTLTSKTTISMGVVNNPPPLPSGLNYVGTSVSVEPDGLSFENPMILELHYDDFLISDAGVSDDSDLQLYSYNLSSEEWSLIDSFSVDRASDTVTAEINHFSYYAVTCFSQAPPEDVGIPYPGCLVYSLGAVWNEGDILLSDNWMPGHVGIYTGERVYDGQSLASEEVKKFGLYNIVEALPGGIRFSYNNLPNSTETYEENLISFGGRNLYGGAREPKIGPITREQGEEIIQYVLLQIGKPYALGEMIGSFFSSGHGPDVKGPDTFNCVGLAEASYETAGINDGIGLITLSNEEWLITPAEQYNATQPASGHYANEGAPKIPFVIFDNWGEEDQWTQIGVMNEDGSGIEQLTFDDTFKNFPRLSPKGDKIIFEVYDAEETSTLYTMNLDGTTLLELTGSEHLVSPSLSSQGKLAYLPQYGLQTLKICNFNDFSNKESLTETYSDDTPFFSPDGNFVVYSTSNKDINEVEVSTQNVTTLISGSDTISNREPSYSHSGEQIVFMSDMDDDGNYDIYSYTTSTGLIQRLTTDSSMEYSPFYSSDDSKIFYCSDNSGPYQIYSMNPDGSGKTQLTFEFNNDFGIH